MANVKLFEAYKKSGKTLVVFNEERAAVGDSILSEADVLELDKPQTILPNAAVNGREVTSETVILPPNRAMLRGAKVAYRVKFELVRAFQKMPKDLTNKTPYYVAIAEGAIEFEDGTTRVVSPEGFLSNSSGVAVKLDPKIALYADVYVNRYKDRNGVMQETMQANYYF